MSRAQPLPTLMAPLPSAYSIWDHERRLPIDIGRAGDHGLRPAPRQLIVF